MSNHCRATDLVCFFFAMILLCMSLFAYTKDVRMYEFYTGLFCAAFCFVPPLMHHAGIMKLPSWMVISILVAIFLHAFGVLILAYDVLEVYDTLTHSFSSFVISLCAILTLMCLQTYNPRIHFTVGFVSVLILFIMMSFGVIWEVFELAVDQITGTGMQYSVWDTIRDMISNAIGSMIGSVFINLYARKYSVEVLIESINLHPKLREFLGSSK